jgi:hypothetical protein
MRTSTLALRSRQQQALLRPIIRKLMFSLSLWAAWMARAPMKICNLGPAVPQGQSGRNSPPSLNVGSTPIGTRVNLGTDSLCRTDAGGRRSNGPTSWPRTRTLKYRVAEGPERGGHLARSAGLGWFLAALMTGRFECSGSSRSLCVGGQTPLPYPDFFFVTSLSVPAARSRTASTLSIT